MTEALQIIRLEHFNFGRVLGCLRRVLEVLDRNGSAATRELLFLILEYAESVPVTHHHPKEDRYFYAALRRRLPAVAPILAELEAEHAEGPTLLAAFRKTVEALDGSAQAVQQVRDAGSAYLTFELRHMLREEREILPYALDVLTEDDWIEINQAFKGHKDPLFSNERTDRFKALYRAILGLTASTLGGEDGGADPGGALHS